MSLRISLDQGSRHNLSRQLYEELRRAIVAGEVEPGQLLPSTRALSQQLDVSRATVVAAYNRLKSEGYVTGQDGSGTYASSALPAHPLADQKKAAGKLQSRMQTGRLSSFARRMLTFEPLPYAPGEPEIAFYGWRGALDSVPVRQLAQSFSHVTRKLDSQLLDYSTDPLGYAPLRESIAKWLRKSRGLKCQENQIMIVSGWRQAVSLLSRLHIERGDLVAVEDPSYPAIREIFEGDGAAIFPVTVDERGMEVGELAAANLQRINLVYTCPSHQHPTGAVLSLDRRFELLAWAQNTGALIIEDEHDSEFRYSGAPVPPLKALDQNNQVIFVGTFNKSLFPSLGIAYMVVPENLVDIYYRARDFSGEHVPTLLQATLADFMQSGLLVRHVRKMHDLYARRRQCLLMCLQKYFGERVAVAGDQAGMHVMVRFDTFMSEQVLISKALDAGVGLLGTSRYYIDAVPEAATFLLGYADLPESKIEEGVKRLAAIVL